MACVHARNECGYLSLREAPRRDAVSAAIERMIMPRVENHSKAFDFDNGGLCAGASYWDDDKYTFATRDHSAEDISREDAPKLIDALTRWLAAGE